MRKMFCPKCGNEINDNGRFCPKCGFEFRKETVPNYANNQVTQKKKKGFSKTVKIVIGISAVLCVVSFILNIVDIFNHNADAKNTIKTLRNFAYEIDDDDEYLFSYGEDVDWIITYSPENDFVDFNDYQATQCLAYAIGDEQIGSDGTCGYDFSDKQFRIYVDYDANDGHLSIVSYSLEDDEFILNLEGQRCEPSDEFEQDLRNSGIIDAFKYDLNTFKKDLKDNNLSFEDVSSLTYSDF
jgi:hypothetical protein